MQNLNMSEIVQIDVQYAKIFLDQKKIPYQSLAWDRVVECKISTYPKTERNNTHIWIYKYVYTTI